MSNLRKESMSVPIKETKRKVEDNKTKLEGRMHYAMITEKWNWES